jgi:hypothetical protein
VRHLEVSLADDDWGNTHNTKEHMQIMNWKLLKFSRNFSMSEWRTVRTFAETYMRGAETTVQMTIAADIKSGLTLNREA